jgi:hypothetical protein
MVAGPYRANSSDPKTWSDNLRLLNNAAYAVFLKGHVPIIGVNKALPIIEAAGESAYDAVMMPLFLILTDRCDAALRVGGVSGGADEEIERFANEGCQSFGHLRTYRWLDHPTQTTKKVSAFEGPTITRS